MAPPPLKMPKNSTFRGRPAGRGGTVRIALRDSSGRNRGCYRTPMVPMLHLDHRRPITFAVWTVRAGYTVGIAFP